MFAALCLEVALKLKLNYHSPINVHSFSVYADGGSRKLFLKDKEGDFVGIKLDRKMNSSTTGKFFIDTSCEKSLMLNSEEEAYLKKILDVVTSSDPEEIRTVEIFKSYL